MWDQMVLKPDDDSARTGEYVYWGYDFKPALPPAEPTCVAVKLVWLECVGLEVLVVSVACNRDRVTVAISARELRTAGPLAKVLGAICSAAVPVTVMVPGRGRISPQAVPGVDTDMEYTGKAPLIALEVGLAAVTVVLMG